MQLLWLLLAGTMVRYSVGEEFWLSVELMSIDWRKGCLTTAGCAQPRFKMTASNPASDEHISISWTISEHLIQDRSRSFTSHWDKGTPEDVTMMCEVVGVDPTYGFPRICDSSDNTRIFLNANPVDSLNKNETTVVERRRRRDTESNESQKGKMVVEMKGKCFNATLTAQKHEKRCPWCEQYNEVAIIGQQFVDGGSSPDTISYLVGSESVVYAVVIVLACIALLSSASFACLFVAYLRQKRLASSRSNTSHLSSSPNDACRAARVDSLHSSDDSRYEMPWEQKYRPLPHWMSSSHSETLSSSPLQSGSPVGCETVSNHTSRTVVGSVVAGRDDTSPRRSSAGGSDAHNVSGTHSV